MNRSSSDQHGDAGFAAVAAPHRTPRDEVQQFVDAVMASAFGSCYTPRSEPYRVGVRAVLLYRTRSLDARLATPYRLGTAEADAFFAGVERGHQLWREEAQAKYAALQTQQTERLFGSARLRISEAASGA